MKIAFDYQTFMYQPYGGVSRYYNFLATELLKQQQDVNIFAGLHRNRFIKDLPKGVVKGMDINDYPPKTGRIFKCLNHTISEIKIKTWRPDIIHETYYSSFPTLKTNAVRVTSVYDMIHELFKGQFSPCDKTTQLKKKTFARVDHIFSISHSTKRDLIELFGIDEKMVSVVHLGVNLNTFKNWSPNFKNSVKPFVLYVGGRSGYKNFIGFLKAIASSLLLRNEIDIVTFGGGAFNSEEKEIFKQCRFNDNQIRNVTGSDEVLASLYKQAIAFVYPSLYEGFGLPPLEAMAAGCPVVCSNTSSMPEVVGAAGEYFNPNNIDEMRLAIENVVFSEEKKDKLISLGYKNVEYFSWQRCATETLDIYKNLTGLV
jgi:glycosyltransferase involved in cell wall biosynthesis